MANIWKPHKIHVSNRYSYRIYQILIWLKCILVYDFDVFIPWCELKNIVWIICSCMIISFFQKQNNFYGKSDDHFIK